MDRAFLTRPTTITGRFGELAAGCAGNVAVTGEEGEITYAELDDRSSRLARRLQDLGVRLGDVVAVEGSRRIATIVGLIAILKAGACYLALDRRYPPHRTEVILRDAGARVVLVQEGDQPRLPPGCRAVPLLDDSPGDGPEPVGLTAGHTAYLAYTSGSTGAPKGVCVPHRAVSRLVIDADFLPIRADDVFLQYAPIAFDASTLEIWGPLLNGARLVLAPPSDLSVAELTKIVSHHGVTVLWLTAGLFHQVTESGLAELRGLRYLIAGGDVLSPPHVERAVTALPETVVLNGYGPTENTTFTCCHRVTLPLDGAVPIGRPIRGTGVYILDSDLRPVPAGETGELFATGAGLAHGYLGSPELTAEKFLPDTVSGLPGARMYRTGDLARTRPDGTLEYHGRADRQVKIRGFRIELGEVEAAVAGLAGVATAAVVVQRRPSGDKHLVAWAAGAPDQRLSALHIRRRLREILPDYAIPSVVRIVDEVPLTSSGKVDRALLAADVSRERPELTAPYREAATALEAAVVELWTDHLGITGIGADDDFFELGGHSLVGVRIIGDLEREYGVEVPPVAFYLSPSPAGLASEIEKGLQAG